MSRFPNFFILLGPGTGLGHNSVIYMIESQIGYVLGCLGMMNTRRISTVEVRPDAQAAYDADIQSRLGNTVWASGLRQLVSASLRAQPRAVADLHLSLPPADAAL